MKTQELIKQAEELFTHDPGSKYLNNDYAMLMFARNHLPEIVDKLKKYEAVVIKADYGIATNKDWNSHEQLIEKVNELSGFAKEALEE